MRGPIHALGAGNTRRGHHFVLIVLGLTHGEERLNWGRRITLPGPQVPRSGGYRALVDLAAVHRELHDLAPDRIEVSDRFTLGPVGTWARNAGVPALVVAHERVDGVLRAHLRLPSRLPRAAADRRNRKTAGRCDHVVTTSRFAAEQFERVEVETVHVPLGVDLEVFAPAPFLDGPREVTALFVLCSRLSREKHPELAMEALAILRAGGLRARLIVPGDGPLLPGLRARSRGLPVTFVGHVPNRNHVAQLLARADAVLAPGPIETFGLAALEAMACGTPAVAAKTSAVADLVGDRGGRTAVPNARAFADAILDLLAEPSLDRRYAARRRAEQFPWEGTVQRLLEVHTRQPASTAGTWPSIHAGARGSRAGAS